jgi:hypothetical protein
MVLGHEVEEALGYLQMQQDWSLFALQALHGFQVHLFRIKRPISVDSFSFGAAFELFHGLCWFDPQHSVILCNVSFCGLVKELS